MTRRRMGEGSALRVMFGRRPHGSPVGNTGCAVVAVASGGVFVASTVYTAYVLTGGHL